MTDLESHSWQGKALRAGQTALPKTATQSATGACSGPTLPQTNEGLTQRPGRSNVDPMSALTLELRPRAEQTTFNLRRWDEVSADPELTKVAGRVETDRHGRIIMSPPPAPRHGRLQAEIAALLKKLLPSGTTVTESPVSTADGVNGVDVAWASAECWKGELLCARQRRAGSIGTLS